MKAFASEIYAAVRSGKLREPIHSYDSKARLSWVGRRHLQGVL